MMSCKGFLCISMLFLCLE